jgi:hypothetical protein
MLGADDVIQSGHPDVVALARGPRRDDPNDSGFGAAAFEWVRDQVAHALEVQDRRVTLTAVEVLRERSTSFARSAWARRGGPGAAVTAVPWGSTNAPA